MLIKNECQLFLHLEEEESRGAGTSCQQDQNINEDLIAIALILKAFVH